MIRIRMALFCSETTHEKRLFKEVFECFLSRSCTCNNGAKKKCICPLLHGTIIMCVCVCVCVCVHVWCLVLKWLNAEVNLLMTTIISQQYFPVKLAHSEMMRDRFIF